jgi:hypothetical protein
MWKMVNRVGRRASEQRKKRESGEKEVRERWEIDIG